MQNLKTYFERGKKGKTRQRDSADAVRTCNTYLVRTNPNTIQPLGSTLKVDQTDEILPYTEEEFQRPPAPLFSQYS